MTTSSTGTGADGRADTARIRHDLRSPLNLVVGYAEILVEDLGDPSLAPERQAMEAVLQGAREALRHIDGALSGSPGEAGTAQLAALEKDLRGSRDRIHAAVGNLAPREGKHLPATWGADIGRIRAAADALVGWFALEQARQAPADGAGGVATASAGAPRILVVDDVEGNRTVLQRRLEKQGYEVGCAVDGEAALRELAARPYDLVLLDILMPVMDGFAVLKRMRESGDLKRIPVVVISAMDDLSSVAKCIEMGAADHLTKPFEPVLLKARVAACLEKKRLRDVETEVLRGLERVAEAARGVEAGKFEPGCLEEFAGRKDGLGVLARVFSAMAVEVAGREQRLRGQVDDLRREVDRARKTSSPTRMDEGPSILPMGEVFAGRYEILAHLGSGGMGTVYRARDRELAEDVALKILHTRRLGTGSEGSLDRFKSEIRLARRITHRNIVRTHDFGASGEMQYLTMEIVDGLTLREILDRGGRMAAPGVVALALQLVEALGVAHAEGIIHRDIKPPNLILDGQGVLKIMDFGVARLRKAPRELTMAGSLVGTPLYMAPEQILSGNVDERTDLYSVGVVLFECLTGRPPFVSENQFSTMTQVLRDPVPSPGELAPGIPEPLCRLLLRLMEKKPEDRYPNAAAVARDLSQI